jgi:hypothetical protein
MRVRRMRPRDRQIQRRGRALVELVTSHLPQEFARPAGNEGWPAVGVALLARMAATLEAVLDLQPRQRLADPAVLVRSLYEHAVHFAWLAADPSEARIEAWRKSDLLARLKADADAEQRGIGLLSDERRAEFKAKVAVMQGHALNLADLAVAADGAWEGKIRALSGEKEPLSFRGLYALLYRWFSSMLHPSANGLNRVYDDLGPNRIRIRPEREYRGVGPFNMATLILGLALFVASDSIGWPPVDEIDAVFGHNPVDDAQEET